MSDSVDGGSHSRKGDIHASRGSRPRLVLALAEASVIRPMHITLGGCPRRKFRTGSVRACFPLDGEATCSRAPA